MILVDTSVWIDHLRSGDKMLAHLLDSSQVLTHPFVIGELACGNLSNRTEVLTLLADLPRVVTATDKERFLLEAGSSLPRLVDGEPGLEEIYTAMLLQRACIKSDQQLVEWSAR